MPKNLLWKWIAIVCVMAASLAAVSGLPTSKNELIANLQKNIRLGLDLRGGSHIVLQIQVQDAFKAEADLAMDRLREVLAKESISYNSIDRNEPASIDTANTIQVNIKGLQGSKSGDLRRIIRDAVGDEWNLSADGSSTDYRLNLRPEAAAALRESTLAQAASILEKKVNGLGVAEATVQRRGGAGSDAEIVVQIPGVDDPARVKSILQTSAMLELSEVKSGPYSSHAEAVAANNGALPLNSRLVPDGARKGASSGSEKPLWLLSRSPVVTGRDLRTAQAQQSPTSGSWETSFVLTQDAASRFERFTGSHIGTRLAIVLDNSVISAPTIEGKIADSGVINNIGSQQDAADLALNLRSGSLPAGVKPMDDRTIGPSLGADSIRHGITAGLVGLALVIVSMIAYYRGAGLNAVFALLLNTLLTVAALSLIDATWTLPGIAGLVLSIGMAVDSNVLIFERIKEELRSGKAVPPAIGAGFDRALLTIIDTHVTTVVASAFLFIFGTGPVKGFAVTLVIGLIANLFTAVYVSRAIFSLKLWRTPRLSTLSIGTELFGQTNIDFLSKRAWTLGLSVVALLVSIGSLIVKGGPNYGLDFRGGTQMYVRFDPKPPIDELRQVLTAKLPHASIQESTQSTGDFIIGTELAEESTLEQARQTVEDTLRVRYGNTGNKLDLNTATQAAVLDRLRSTLPGMSDEVLRANVSRILDYRNKETGGIIRDFNEIANLSGVEPQVVTALRQESGLGSFNIRSAGMVGPKAGEELRRQALLATGCALAGMLAYVAFRFRLISGTVAILATIHDVIITLGLFSLTNREIDLTIVAALLTLIGYSMNDKIVVFDRVRENMQHGLRRGQSFLEIVNLSINQTLSRTLLTAGPTLLACVSLYFLGGEVLNGIAFALFTGIVVGTYSSIFVASAMLVMWEQRRKQGSTTSRTVASSSPITVATR